MTFPNGVSQSRTFDRAGRLAAVVNSGPGGPIGGFTYTRDANGNPVDIDVYQGATLNAAESMLVTYDNAIVSPAPVTRTPHARPAIRRRGAMTGSGTGSPRRSARRPSPPTPMTPPTSSPRSPAPAPLASRTTRTGPAHRRSVELHLQHRPQPTSATVAGITHVFTYDGNGNRAAVNSAGAITANCSTPTTPSPSSSPSATPPAPCCAATATGYLVNRCDTPTPPRVPRAGISPIRSGRSPTSPTLVVRSLPPTVQHVGRPPPGDHRRPGLRHQPHEIHRPAAGPDRALQPPAPATTTPPPAASPKPTRTFGCRDTV